MKCGNAENAGFTYTSRMGRPRNTERNDPWPKRARFVELLDAKLNSGATYQEIADALGLVSTRSLEQEFRTNRRPGRGTLERAAVYFGVELWELDGPAADEDFGAIMGVYGKNMTPEMRASFIEMAKAYQPKGQARLAAEDQAPKK